MQGEIRKVCLIPGLGNPMEENMATYYSILAWRIMDRGAWLATDLWVTRSWTWLKWLSTCVHTEETQLGVYSWMDKQNMEYTSVQFGSVWLFATPWVAARQASLSITNSQSILKLMLFESVMPSNHLILCRPLLLLPSIPPSIRVFSNVSGLHIRWPKDWSFSFIISCSNEYSGMNPSG